MNKTFSLEQISKTGSLDSNLITRQYKLDLMARFMGMKSIDPEIRQDQIAKELGYSGSTLQRYTNDINMLSLIEFNKIILTKGDKRVQIQTSMIIQIVNMMFKDVKWLQMT